MRDILSQTPVRSMDEAVAAMTAIDKRLPDKDGLKWFNRLYLNVTTSVRQAAAQAAFADVPFLSELDILFANLYFSAIAAAEVDPASAPAAWRPLLRARQTSGLMRLQFALAGMNAHINHDLALALVATCRARRREPESGSIHADFEKVNAVLAEVVRPIRRSFLDEAVIRYGAGASPLVDLVSNFSIDKARDAAWVSGLTLWHLRGVPFVPAAVRDSLARTVGLVSRQLLTVVELD